MNINNLKRRTPNKKTMIVGRGGKRGKTSGRGGKGQTARAGHKVRPEMRDIIKKMPKLRGRGVNFNTTRNEKPLVVNINDLELLFAANDVVTPAALVEKGIVELVAGSNPRIKILSMGDLTKKLNISDCLVSKEAKAKILSAGGSVK
jgi:large subunit ribosomal protein L15